jgi:hypothetical protein
LVPVLRSVSKPLPVIWPVSVLPLVPATSMVPPPAPSEMARPLAKLPAPSRSVPPPKTMPPPVPRFESELTCSAPASIVVVPR